VLPYIIGEQVSGGFDPHARNVSHESFEARKPLSLLFCWDPVPSPGPPSTPPQPLPPHPHATSPPPLLPSSPLLQLQPLHLENVAALTSTATATATATATPNGGATLLVTTPGLFALGAALGAAVGLLVAVGRVLAHAVEEENGRSRGPRWRAEGGGGKVELLRDSAPKRHRYGRL